jgi:hypothetical protein
MHFGAIDEVEYVISTVLKMDDEVKPSSSVIWRVTGFGGRSLRACSRLRLEIGHAIQTAQTAFCAGTLTVTANLPSFALAASAGRPTVQLRKSRHGVCVVHSGLSEDKSVAQMKYCTESIRFEELLTLFSVCT